MHILADSTIRVCFLSEDSGLADAIGRALGEGFAIRSTKDLHHNQLADLHDWCDVAILDLRSASTQGDSERGLRLLDEIVKIPNHPPAVVVCDTGNSELLLEAVARGAYDSVTNLPSMVELRLILRRAYNFYAAERELERLRASSRGTGRLHELLGTSQAMQELFALAQKIAPCDVSVLITGETGTGKELLARAIHRMSSRSARQMVAFSCANLPETLIEDELFGHERGAFTGAMTMRRGRVETADQGTLFLDEIGDLGVGLQPKLLRVLQERKFERLGGNTTVDVNIRLICASNRNLGEMVQQGKFRDDLYYRLNVVQLHLPALRERRDDIPLLVQHFLETCAQQFNKKAKRFSPPAMQALEEYGWPGNVRELLNVVQRAVVLAEGPTVEIRHLPAGLRSECEGPKLARSYEEEVREFKKRLVLRTLRECGWSKTETARTLGVARAYLHRLINQLGIEETEEAPTAIVATPSLPSGQIVQERMSARSLE